MPRLTCPTPAQWLALPEAARRDLLREGGCMPDQGRVWQPGQRPYFGTGFEFGDSPVTRFAMMGPLEALNALRDALALGAMPFARDSEDDGAFKYAFRQARRHAVGSPERAIAESSIHACWEAGRPYLQPGHALYVGMDEAANIRFDLALACFSNGGLLLAQSLGLPVGAGWLLAFEPYLPLLRAEAIGWSHPGQIAAFEKAGMDFSSPVTVIAGEPDKSLWNWLEDSQPDPQGAALALLRAGNDPRSPDPTGEMPLNEMAAEPASSNIARWTRSFLLAMEESEALGALLDAAPAPARARSKPGI